MSYKNIPWCEKYRPSNYDNIILNENNDNLFKNMLKTNKFHNLLFYGPPGTGKTTTIINLIDKYQELNYGKKIKSLIIHLNASDDRGIDIIRNNIYNFINSEDIFNVGTKFVILDEVDYMTKIAQQALKCIIKENNNNNNNNNNNKVVFCLICNYISKIEYSLVDEFIKIKFNNLPKDKIYDYINNINIKENLNLNKKNIYLLINYFNYDIRNMLNFLQSSIFFNKNVMDYSVNEKILLTNLTKNFNIFLNNIKNIELKYKLTLIQIFKNYIFFILYYKIEYINKEIINELEYIIHNMKNNELYIKYIYNLIKKNITI